MNLLNIDNMVFEPKQKYHLIFCDYVYENKNFSWAEKYWQYLLPNGIFIAMSDWHTQHYFRVFVEDQLNAVFVNHIPWRNEWGNFRKTSFHQCHDDIMIYSNGEHWLFDQAKAQVPKKTLTKGLNPSGRTTKIAPAWIDDIVLTTVAKERVKKKDGKLVRWQKPQRLYDRVLGPFVKEGDSILDLFAGTASLWLWCKKNNLDYTGIENDKEVYDLAVNNVLCNSYEYRPKA